MPEPADGLRPTMRLDKWLFNARFFKTRGLAAKILTSGKLKLNGNPVAKAGVKVGAGDVLVFPKADHVRTIRVTGLPDRRGPYQESLGFYADLDPPTQANALPRLPGHLAARPPRREQSAGRPTKRERRAIDKLQGDE